MTEIMKQIQASNEQYKFRADLLKYHDALQSVAND